MNVLHRAKKTEGLRPVWRAMTVTVLARNWSTRGPVSSLTPSSLIIFSMHSAHSVSPVASDEIAVSGPAGPPDTTALPQRSHFLGAFLREKSISSAPITQAMNQRDEANWCT